MHKAENVVKITILCKYQLNLKQSVKQGSYKMFRRQDTFDKTKSVQDTRYSARRGCYSNELRFVGRYRESYVYYPLIYFIWGDLSFSHRILYADILRYVIYFLII